MWICKEHIIAETQRGLLFKDEQFIDVLMPGVHKITNWKKRFRVEIIDITDTLEKGVAEHVLNLRQLHADKLDQHLMLWETDQQEVGLVYQDNVLQEILAPGQHGAYWKGFKEISVKKRDISDDFKLDKTLARRGRSKFCVSRNLDKLLRISPCAKVFQQIHYHAKRLYHPC